MSQNTCIKYEKINVTKYRYWVWERTWLIPQISEWIISKHVEAWLFVKKRVKTCFHQVYKEHNQITMKKTHWYYSNNLVL
jgi:hypothetical protein